MPWKALASSNPNYIARHPFKRPWPSQKYVKFAVEEELIQCKKSLYLEKNTESEFQYLSQIYPEKGFYYLKGDIPEKRSGWTFTNLEYSRIPALFAKYIESGIYVQMHFNQVFKENLKRKQYSRQIKAMYEKRTLLDMNSSVQTVFILLSALLSLSLVFFAAEYYLYFRVRLNYRVVVVVAQVARKICFCIHSCIKNVLKF